MANWNNRIINFIPDDLRLISSQIESTDEGLSKKSYDLNIIIQLVPMADNGDRSDKKYFDLGNGALIATQASTVVSIGTK